MGAFEIEITGLEELLQKLERISRDLSQDQLDAIEYGMQPFLDAANRGAPEPLITYEVVEKSPQRVVVEIGFPEEKWYWRFLETGASPHEIKGEPRLAFEGRKGPVFPHTVQHPGMAARPFLRPAYDETREQIERRVMDFIKGLLE